MELVILGTSAAFAGKSENCSSYLLRTENTRFVIDAGPGSFGTLQRYISHTFMQIMFLISTPFVTRYMLLRETG